MMKRSRILLSKTWICTINAVALIALNASMANGQPTYEDTLANLRIVNVTDSAYGATPDDTVDDTAAIQSAIDAVCQDADRRAVLYIPPGEYIISDTLRIDNDSQDTTKRIGGGLRIVGGGASVPHVVDGTSPDNGGGWRRRSKGTVLVWRGASKDSGGDPMIKLRDQTALHMSDLSLDGNTLTDGTTSNDLQWAGMGIQVHSSVGGGSGRILLENITIAHCHVGLAWGLGVDVTEGRNDTSLVQQCAFENCNIAVQHHNQFSVSVEYHHPFFRECGIGIQVNDGGNIDIYGAQMVGGAGSLLDIAYGLDGPGGMNLEPINVFGGKFDNQGDFIKWLTVNQDPDNPTPMEYQINFYGVGQSHNGTDHEDHLIEVAPKMRVLVEGSKFQTNNVAKLYGGESANGTPYYAIFLARNCTVITAHETYTSLADMIVLPTQANSGDYRQWSFENCWNGEDGVLTNEKSGNVTGSSTAWPN